MSVALLPQLGGTMDDSAMQEDHPGDAAIAIDMESPKHQEQTTHEMAFTTTVEAQPYWTTGSEHNADAQLVDVEFDTEDHGMMSAAEVEMSGAPHGEEYEYEMTYESGELDTHYETIDAEVQDAELHDVTVPHVESDFAAPSLDPVVEPVDMLTNPPVDLSTTVISPGHPLPSEPEILAVPTVHELPPLEEPAAVLEGPVAVIEVPSSVLDSGQPAPLLAVENLEPGLEEPSSIEVHSPETIRPPERRPEELEEVEVAALAEAPTEESVAEIHPPEQQAEETAEVAQDQPEDVNQSGNVGIPVTTVLLTAVSEASTVSQTLALFKDADVSLIPSTSQSTSDTPVTLLDQHQHLFAEPIAVMLMQLRTELQSAEPAIFSQSEFEFREFQLIVRDLQLVLTEDNIYAHKISLSDLASMHRSCGLSGYLHLDISLQSRFIDRYNVIRQAIENHANSGLVDPAPSVPDEVTEAHIANNHPEPEATYEVGEPEPPLPEDADGDAWSEEQEEYQADPLDESAQNPAETNEWEDVGEDVGPVTEDQEEQTTGVEEYVHEDEYVPGDELPFAGFDETELANEYDETTEVDVKAHDHAPDRQEDESLTGRVLEPTTNLEGITGHETYHVKSIEDADDTGVNAVESELDEQVEPTLPDDEDWGDEEYDELVDGSGGEGAHAEEATPYEEQATVEPSPEPLDTQPQPSPARPPIDREPTLPEPVKHEKHSINLQEHSETTPVRKRSFSEVEEEPEDGERHSPGLKKPRHA